MARPDPSFWAGRRVLLTGHTGFKGSWIAAWLMRLGARVHGLALPPETEPSLHALLALDYDSEALIDLRDRAATAAAVAAARPQIVIHAAAPPLVRRGYDDPVATFATNVMGTAHLLDALRDVAGLEAVLVVTSDKAYDNPAYETADANAAPRPFVETDPLGGRDPYSASKGAQEIVTRSFAQSFLAAAGVPVATARAGNVIGGGDRSPDRLMVDIVRALETGTPLRLRNPEATRPWQHVLEPAAGYLLFIERLAAGLAERALNFGPDRAHTVREVVETALAAWPGAPGWQREGTPGPAEARTLELDASRARRVLGWKPHLGMADAVRLTVAWHRDVLAGGDARAITLEQIAAYEEMIGPKAAT